MRSCSYYAILLLLALSAAGVASCANSSRSPHAAVYALPVPSNDAVRNAGLNPASAQEGRKLYDAKCLRCHKSYDPHAYTGPQWDAWMNKMSRKAHLDTGQQDLLVRFLEAVRSTPPPDKQ